MKYVKTILAAFLALCLILGLAAPVFATEATETTGAAAESTAAATEDTVADATEEDTADPTEAVTDGTDGDEDDTTTTGEEEHDHEHEEEVPENPVRKAFRIVLIVLEVIASIILILVVLMQSGKESGLSSTISGNSDSYLSKNGLGGLDKKLSKATKWVALVWVVLTLLLSIV